MVPISQLIDLCEQTYQKCSLVVGPDGIHGANLFTMPNGEIVLCFRGTLANHTFQSALDWITDSHAELVAADGFAGRVHAGFLSGLNALWDGVMATLEGQSPAPPEPKLKPWWQCCWFGKSEKQEPPLPWNKKLIIVGHSKGGALAQMAAVRLKQLRPAVRTFGAPMWTDLEGSTDYPHEVDLIAYENNFDLVPFLPGRLAGYREIGNCKTQLSMPRYMREIAVGKLIAEGKWAQIRDHHTLVTGYRPWCAEEPPPAQSQAEAA